MVNEPLNIMPAKNRYAETLRFYKNYVNYLINSDQGDCIMTMFKSWLNKRIQEEFGMEDPNFKSDSDISSSDDEDRASGTDYEELQQDLFKTVMRKYPDEAMQFLQGIAQRGDQEITSILRRMKKDKPQQMSEPRHPSDTDEVVPSSADMGHGGGNE